MKTLIAVTSTRSTGTKAKNYLYKARLAQKSIYLPCTLKARTEIVTTEALLDSGAMDNYIDIQFIQKHGLKQQSIPPRPVFNVDGSPNKAASITHKVFVKISLSGRPMKIEAYATVLDQNPLILGMTWFKRFNPQINWLTGQIRFQWDRLIQAIQTFASNIPQYLAAFLDVFSKKTAE